MPTPRRRHSRCRRDKRRTHDKLATPNTARCDACGAPKRGHRICPACGVYKGRSYRAVVTTQ